MIRGQQYLDTAYRHVEAVRDATKDAKPEDKRRRIYGGLCHTFPMLVRTNGLCQALAFVAAKAASSDESPSDQAWAYKRLNVHVADVLGVTIDPLDEVRHAALTDYMRHTRTILDAWVYYRRFAVSVLEVEADAQDGTEP